MERIIIAAVFVTIGTFIGFYQSARLKNREENITEIIRFLEEAAVQIRYRGLPINELFSGMRDGRFKFIDSVNRKTALGKNWRDAWEETCGEAANLTDDDRELLRSVGKQLGSSDVLGQIAMLELNRSLFGAKLAEASADQQKKGKMYRTVGLLMGIGAAAIII